VCKAAGTERSPSPEVKQEPEIKLEPEVKLEPEIKQEPFTIRGYFGIGETLKWCQRPLPKEDDRLPVLLQKLIHFGVVPLSSLSCPQGRDPPHRRDARREKRGQREGSFLGFF
jgi:hypothetical protein